MKRYWKMLNCFETRDTYGVREVKKDTVCSVIEHPEKRLFITEGEIHEEYYKYSPEIVWPVLRSFNEDDHPVQELTREEYALELLI